MQLKSLKRDSRITEARSVKNILSRDTKASLSPEKALVLFLDADLSKAKRIADLFGLNT